MKKIPTLFARNPEARSRLLRDVAPGCEWVVEGEGVATRKFDGACCMVRDGKLYKRREVKPGKPTPDDFEEVQCDPATYKRVGWVPVGDGPEDKWFRQAVEDGGMPEDGTYELVGPKVQGGAESGATRLVRHGATVLDDVPRDYDGLGSYLERNKMEGIVWHHPDGRRAKIKRRDFGFSWP